MAAAHAARRRRSGLAELAAEAFPGADGPARALERRHAPTPALGRAAVNTTAALAAAA